MKKILLLVLVVFCQRLVAQKKGSWSITASAGLVTNTSPDFKITNSNPGFGGNPGIIFIDSTGNQLTFIHPVSYKEILNKLNYKAEVNVSFSAGAKFYYPINKKWSIAAGADLSYSNMKRVAENEAVKYSRTGAVSATDSIFIGNPSNTFFIGTVSVVNDYPTRNESFSFLALNIPLTAAFNFRKLIFEGGLATSFLIKSVKQPITIKQNLEYSFSEPPFENNTAIALSFILCPSYQITDKIQFGIAYNHGLTSLIDAENYRPLLAKSVSFKLAYKL